MSKLLVSSHLFLPRTIETPKAPVKKIRFAPGKGNTKIFVLYSSRFDIREIGEEGLISQLKWGGRDASSHLVVEDADWATSDKPVLLTGDGCVRVFDIKLQQCQSVVTVADFAGTSLVYSMLIRSSSIKSVITPLHNISSPTHTHTHTLTHAHSLH